jgi:hypothetical protein
MQAELEKWELENAAPCRFFMDEAQDEMMVPLDAVRALLEGKVLCEKEPVMYCNPTTGDVLPSGVVNGANIIRYVGYTRLLYAPASPMGSAHSRDKGGGRRIR